MLAAWVSPSHLTAHKINWKITLQRIIQWKQKKKKKKIVNAFVPARFSIWSRAHTHLTILCRILMANVLNAQCFILIAIIIVCAVFFVGFSRNGKIGRRMLSLHEQMSIIIIKYSQVKHWVSFLFSIRSSPFCKCVCACGSKFNCAKVIAIIIWSVR